MNTLWQTLKNAQLIQGEEPSKKMSSSPWYIKALLAFSGWLAAIFMLGFLALGFNQLIQNEFALLLIGVVFIFISYITLKKEPSDFVEHLVLAISFSGQVLVFVGLMQILNQYSTLFWFIIMLLQVLLTLKMPNFIHQLFSSFFGAYAFSFVVAYLGMGSIFLPSVMLFASYIWLNEFYHSNITRAHAIGYGLVFILITVQGMILSHTPLLFWSYSSMVIEPWFPYWLGSFLTGAVTLFVALSLLKAHHQPLTSSISLSVIISLLILSLVAIKIPSLLLGILIMILAFAHSNRLLLGLGIVSFLFSISAYYYYLEITLLQKALILGILGLVILIARWFIFHVLLSHKGEKNV